MSAAWGKRVAAVAAAASLLVAGAGAAPASAAATYWRFQSQYNGNCLTASAVDSSVFVTSCRGWQAQDWDWTSVGDPLGYQHQLMSRTRGLCLTTDNNSNRNAVWLGTCRAGSFGQYWNWDGQYLDASVYYDINSLRTSPGFDAVYTSDAYTDMNVYDIIYENHWWTASTHS